MPRMTDHVRGVPLARIGLAFDSPGVRVYRGRDSISFSTTTVRVEAPTGDALSGVDLSAVVRVRCSTLYGGKSLDDAQLMRLNGGSALGSVVRREGHYAVESRLTTRSEGNPWDHYVPLVQVAALHAAQALTGGGGRLPAIDGDWPGDEFPKIAEAFEDRFVCNGDPGGFTAEIPLRPGPASAIEGSLATALVRMIVGESHPVLGNGLYARLDLPHQFHPVEQLPEVIARLNDWDLEGTDLPPHFGAWCEGSVANPAYHLFWPTRVHQPGLTRALFDWLRVRAVMADGYLVSHGIEDVALSVQSRSTAGRG